MPYKKYSRAEKEQICNLINKGQSVKQISEQLSIPIANLYRWQTLFNSGISLESGRSSGRKRLLTKEEEEDLTFSLDENPELSNRDLAAIVNNKIAPRTVSDYLRSQSPPFVKKQPTDEEPIDDNKALAEGKKFLLQLRKINNSIRIYQDESFVYDNERPRLVRARRGKIVHRKRKRKGKRYAFSIAMTEEGLLHPPYLIKENFNDENFMIYVREELAPVLKSGMVVFWDRLGRSGRKKNPIKQHFNPTAKEIIEKHGCKLIFLPPYGKFFNPCELVNSFLKTEIRRMYVGSAAAQTQRARTFKEMEIDLKKAAEKLNQKICQGFFRERANGRAFKERYGIKSK